MPERETGSLERNIGDKRVESKCQKDKMMISSENVGKVTIEGKFPSAFCRKDVGSNSILGQFWSCWLPVVLKVN